MRRVLKEILTEGGYTVVAECQNGQEAIKSYQEQKPDLVLLDYNMPSLNGIEAARTILQQDSAACIVMVTAIGSKKRILEALRIGVKNYITKPFENSSFLNTIGKVLGPKAPIKARANEMQDAEFQVIGSFFGQYLLQKGLLTKDQLLDVLEIQNTVNRKAGQIAVDDGLLLPKHVEMVLRMQKRVNKYFGQLAIQMGFLTTDQVNIVLDKQKEHYLDVEEIIVREKILPVDLVQKELQIFKSMSEEDQGVFNMQWVSKHIQNGFVYEFFIEQTMKLLMRLAGIFVMEGECHFDSKKKFTSCGILIKVSLAGDSHWSYFLNLSDELAQEIAHAMIETDNCDNTGDLAIEAANEFANISCGNALAKLDVKGVKLDITPPITKRIPRGEPLSFTDKEQVLCVPILVPEGEMELLIAGVEIFRPVEVK